MSEPIVYVDRSEVREGQLEQLEAAMSELAAFVEDNEPTLFTYAVYFDEDRTSMTVVHVHPDSASLALHMKVGGPEFPKVAEFISLVSIDVYGRPDEDVVEQLRSKAQMLGTGMVQVHEPLGGFARFPAG